jgi:hypothetical protein
MYESNQSFVDSAACDASALQSAADAASFTQYNTGKDTASMHDGSNADSSIVVSASFIGNFYEVDEEVEENALGLYDPNNDLNSEFAGTVVHRTGNAPIPIRV